MIPDNNIIRSKNCLINKFIRYHFDNIKIPTKIQRPKNIFNQISQNATLA